jgi:hypothetical protein
MFGQRPVRVRKPLSVRRDDGNVVGIRLAVIRSLSARVEFERRVKTEE